VNKENRKRRNRGVRPDLSPDKIRHRDRVAAVREYRSIRSKQVDTVNLGDAIEWLSQLDGRGARSIDTDPQRLKRAVDDLKNALFDGVLGGSAAHPITMVADDQEICDFTEKDIALAKKRPNGDSSKANMYDETGSAKELLRRLWVCRQLLTRLFRTRLWPMPDWLLLEPKTSERKRLSTKGNKTREIETVIREKFPEGAPSHLTAQERNDVIWNALKEKGMKTLPVARTIERAISKMNRI
jgi:hypothetical protein